MRVFQFTEQPYPDAWDSHAGSLRVNLPNGLMDPEIAADLYHRYFDEWELCDELGFDIMVNEHHSTATCMASIAVSTIDCASEALSRDAPRARAVS